MLLLRSLGEALLEGGPVSLAGRRRELALTTFLARRGPRPVLRSELVSLLWEGRDEARGRQSLRQALLELKRVLGDALRLDGEQVTIAGEWLTLDVNQMVLALDEGRSADAVALWRGEFLSGMDDIGGEAFRSWLEAEREGLRNRIRVGFSKMVEGAAAAGDWDQAAQRAARWAEAFPLAEDAHRRLVEVLHLAGRNDEALGRHQSFTTRLSADLGESPSVEFTRLRERLLKGDSSRRVPGSAALFTPDLVGRGPALADLLQAWDRVRTGTAVTVLLEGESGLGKSRLAQELLVRLADRGDRMLVLRQPSLRSGESAPLKAAGSLLSALADNPALSGAAPPALAAVATLIPGIGGRFATVSPAASLEDAVVEVITAVAEERPIVLLLDSIRGIDDASQRLLSSVIPRLRASVLTLVITPAEPGAFPLLDGVRIAPGLRRIKLQPLASEDIEAMLASMLALDTPSRRQLAERLHREGGGNPFYVIEMTAALVDEGLLTLTTGSGWRLTPGEGWALPLPASLRDAIARRLQQLDPVPRSVLDAAAVIGRRFDRGILKAVCRMDPVELTRSVDVLMAGRLLREPAGSTGDLEFRDDLTARTAYDLIPGPERARLHGAAARAYAGVGVKLTGSREAVRWHRARTGPVNRPWLWAAGVAAILAGAAILARRSGAVAIDSGRVMVVAFENRTGDSTLNAAGQLLADWITQGIARSQIVPVVDVRTALTSERIVEADTSRRGLARLRAVAIDAGAGRVITGSFAFAGDSLVVETGINDAGSGQVLRALDPVRVASHDPSQAVAQVGQEVLGALALLYNAPGNDLLAGLTRPPAYQAYRTFMDGMDNLVRYQSEEAAARFARAYRLDTTFTQALVWEADAYEQVARWADADSVLRLAAQSRERLGNYERVFLDYRREELAGNFTRALELARELARIAPGSEASFMEGAMSLRLNRPKEALKALAQVDPEKGFLKGWDGFWGYPMQAYLMLGDLPGALDATRKGRRQYPDSRQAVHQEVTVLSAMGHETEVDQLLDVEDGLPAAPGLPLARTIRAAATIFRAFGFDSSARRMAERAVAMTPDTDATQAGDESRLIRVEALYLLDRYAEARPIVLAMARRVPDDLNWKGYTGLVAARLGDRAEADRIMRELANDRRPYAFGRGALWRARIEAALGQNQQAIALLRTGLAQGLTFDQAFISMMPDFRSLETYVEYRELFRPKG